MLGHLSQYRQIQAHAFISRQKNSFTLNFYLAIKCEINQCFVDKKRHSLLITILDFVLLLLWAKYLSLHACIRIAGKGLWHIPFNTVNVVRFIDFLSRLLATVVCAVLSPEQHEMTRQISFILLLLFHWKEVNVVCRIA